MKRLIAFPALWLLCAAEAPAGPLAEMAGTWRGQGWARETPADPQERVRCTFSNSYQGDAGRLTFSGACAIPGRRIDMNGYLQETGGDVVSGEIRNPDAPGSASVSGRIRGNSIIIVFSFREASSNRDISQVVRWTVEDAKISLTTQDRADQSTATSLIEFTRAN